MRTFFAALKGLWKLIVLLLLILLAFSYAMFQGGFVSWFLFFNFLPFALYALALSFYSLKDMKAERVFVKTEYNAGETVKIQIHFTRAKGFPLFYMVIEDGPENPLSYSRQKKKAKTFIFPGFRKEIFIEYLIEEIPRGEHFFRTIRLKTGDLLGLIEKERMLPLENKILVYPAYEELIYRPLENHYDQGMTASKERVQRDTSMAIGIREYQPGDRFSWINWKATAKRNDIMTKEFEQRQSHDVYIIMDCAPDPRFEVIVSFTASIIRAILKKGAQAGLLSSGAERGAFPIRGGESQQSELFYHLAKVKDNSPVTLDRIIESERFFTQQNVTLMFVTAQLTKPLIEKAGFYTQRKTSCILFLIKKAREPASKQELSLKAAANARGIKVVMVQEGQFQDAFSEVSLR
ncbi:hypothetical protein PB1_05672 [Bacillus methanolicus PB1]|uniref:DUF58 domain-containing protein n=1 Tax=Bacillus methanolicus PB1 TaxID=997296 RepID=I3E008_BACMT|nr:DUF58 domain-containing protein [Bacillus methanolicus]EIJ79829.1 hypothetical protein PB1_05672 [Bacillus methanolicus PB1]